MKIMDDLAFYCAKIGQDKMLVQGAGGNVSWKDNNQMQVKASGSWLSDAVCKNIFLPIDLKIARSLIQEGVEDLSRACVRPTAMRPSIETAMHALFPQKIVVHVHAIDVLSLAVLRNGEELMQSRLSGLNWAWVDYVKPGIALANAISSILAYQVPDILILGNHGLVVAGDSIESVDILLCDVLHRCKQTPRGKVSTREADIEELAVEWFGVEYSLPVNSIYHQLALDPYSFQMANDSWAMYPDHVVFLGDKAPIYIGDSSFLDDRKKLPVCIIFEKKGVLMHKGITRSQEIMLHCYVDVLSRIQNPDHVNTLSIEQIADLLNWDAEKYRQKVNQVQ